MLEYVVGSEQHTSNWGKFYIKGLEKWEVKEYHNRNIRDKHHSYQCLVVNAPERTVFTIFEQSGGKHDTGTWNFWICVVLPDDEPTTEYSASYGRGFCNGSYAIVAQATGKIKSPRLMDWWQARPHDADELSYAQHCAEWIEKRGAAVLPPMEVVAA